MKRFYRDKYALVAFAAAKKKVLFCPSDKLRMKHRFCSSVGLEYELNYLRFRIVVQESDLASLECKRKGGLRGRLTQRRLFLRGTAKPRSPAVHRPDPTSAWCVWVFGSTVLGSKTCLAC